MSRFNPYANWSRGSASLFSGGGYGQQGSGGWQNSAPKQETKKCATHGKNRTLKNLEKNDDGEWVCSSNSECRKPPVTNSAGNDGETATCTLHDKTRTVANLGKDNNGDWVCLASSLCKGGGEGSFGMFNYPQNGGWMNNGMYGGGPICSVHGKKRSKRNLIRSKFGEWVCAPGMQCKGGAVQQFTNGNAGNAIKVCSVHGKARSAQNMEKGEDGEWKCTEKYTCKVVPKGAKDSEEQMCSLHNKSRSAPNLEQNEDGEWVCIDGSTCK